MGWCLLIPKGWASIPIAAALTTALAAEIHFTDTITVGSILIGALILIASGILSVRNNVRSFWRNLAVERGEQVKVLEERIVDANTKIQELHEQGKAEMVAFAEEQRIIRHELKNELRAAQHVLSVEQAKTDLSALMELLAQQHSEAMARVTEGLAKQDDILGILASRATDT